MQIEALAAILARDLWMGPKLGLRRSQFFDFRIEHPHPCEPVVDVLSAIASRYATGAADREVNFSAALIEFLRDLRAGLTGADDQHCAHRQKRRIPILARVNLQDVRMNLRAEKGDSRRLVEARSNHDIIR